jgi:acetyl-CoA hydrolase
MNKHAFPVMTAAEAAELIQHGESIGFSGFTAAGAAKAVPRAVGERARAEHEAGRPFKVGVITGASTGPSLDGALAKADAVLFRTPYQSDPDLRKLINSGKTRFFDMHLSVLPQAVRAGFLGKVHWAVVEACEVTPSGEIVPTASVGAAPTFCAVADKIIIELNRAHPAALRGLHDVYEPLNPPHRREIPIYKVSDRIGTPYIKVDPSKIVAIVENDQPDEVAGFDPPSEVTERIGMNVAEFLSAELKSGRIPASFLPVQSGVGNIANAVLGALGKHPDIPAFEMYSEVIQDSVLALMKADRITFASGVSLTLSNHILRDVYENLEHFKKRLVLRPQEISNNPEVVRRLGLISINTAIEVDLFGNVNSTHVMGRHMMNGIGGAGDFTRNAFISIYTCPSIQKGGKISTLVPAVTHTDQNEHSVQVVVTENGVADLRGKDPHERARLIATVCAHPDYRDQLLGYVARAADTHTPESLDLAFAMHRHFQRTGDMRGVDWDEYARS